jgi:hypothetical protein
MLGCSATARGHDYDWMWCLMSRREAASSVNDRLTAALSPNAEHLDADVDVSGAISHSEITVHTSKALVRASWVSTR